MRSKLFAFGALLIIASMALAACQPAAAPTPETIVQTVIVEGESVEVVVTATPGAEVEEETAPVEESVKTLNLNMGPGDIPTLDPSLATDTSSVQIIDLATIGVTRQHEETSALEPGLAETWDISEDGLTYTFHLRQDIPWVKYDSISDEVVQVLDCEGNPRMVTAHDFVYGTLRTLNPVTASDYAYVLAFAMAGAADYNTGATDDPSTVGIRAVDDYTVEMTFNEPAAYNPAIAGMWVARAEPAWLIDGDDCTEARGDRWTETGFYQTYGPYTMKEWVHDAYITMVANPFWPGQDNIPNPEIQEVTWVMLDEIPAFSEFEAGNLDAAAVPSSDIDRVKADPVLSEQLVIAPVLCTYVFGFNNEAPVVDDARVRRAMSMAVDRQSLIDNVLKGGQEPAQWFIRPGLAGAPTMESHPDLGIKFDPEGARAVLQEYLDETGQTVDQLDITLMFNTSSGHQMIAEAAQAMWAEHLGLTVNLVNQEWQVFLDTIRSQDAPQIYRYGWCSDYPDANNFLREVFAVGGAQNPAEGGVPVGGIHYNNPEFEELVIQAAQEQDPDARIELYAQVEELFVDTDAAIIPVYWYTRVTVTKPYVTRSFGVGGQEYIDKWDVDMSQKMGQ
jgi:oligopeptide transport system substrate-binding protein